VRLLFAGLFLATVVAANAALHRWGIVPVGFGLYAPAGVYFAGLTFGLRDALHETGGRRWVLAAIAAGAALSALIDPRLGLASGVAFATGELADLAIYEPLRQRHWTAAVAASNTVGAVTDSLLFLALAGLPLHLWAGQTVGKTYMIAVALPVVWWTRRALSRQPRPAVA
jgi:uncharacterized PurR-regulated membrane protein YhhQ (DUF165 family)